MWYFAINIITVATNYTFGDHLIIEACHNGGNLLVGENSFHCDCPVQYTGDRCETELSCDGVICENGGICEIGANGHICRCPTGSIGSQCKPRKCVQERILIMNS